MKKKLIKSFGLIVFVNIIGALIIFVQFKVFDRKITHIEAELNPILEMSGQLSVDINRIQIKLYKIKSQESIYIDTLINYVEDTENILNTLKKFEDVKPEIETVNDLLVTLEFFKSTISRIVTTNDKDIIMKLNQKALEESLKMRELIDKLHNHINLHTIDERKETLALMQYYPVVFFIILLFVILISFIIVKMTISEVSRPVEILVKGTTELATGNFKHRINTGSKIDEILELSNAFNNMALALDSIEEKKTEAVKQLVITIDDKIKNKIAGIITSIDVVLSDTKSIPEDILKIFLRIKESANEINNTIDKLNNIKNVITTDYIEGIKMLDI